MDSCGGTYDGATARLYVNGVEVASDAITGTIPADTTPVILGGNGNDASGVPTELFPGRIDELMLTRGRSAPRRSPSSPRARCSRPRARDAGTD